MNEITILVVDDDNEIAELIEIYLSTEGYQVLKANDGEEGLALLKANPQIKLIVLDIMMPNVNGLEACQRIRRNNSIPIIMISAKGEDMDKIVGFGTGADDYLAKPFNPLELLARIKSQLRRYTNLKLGLTTTIDEIAVQGLIINKKEHRIRKYDEEINLTPIEFEILHLLALNPGKVYSTEDIFKAIWIEKVCEVNNTVMVHIRRLREKIEDCPRNPKILKTVWGVGYKVES